MSANDHSRGTSSTSAIQSQSQSENDNKNDVITTVDSGFFSQELSSQDCSGFIQLQQQQQQQEQEQVKQQSESMRLDSGVDTKYLSTQFERIHLDENDLGKAKVTFPSISDVVKEKEKKEKSSWETYFRADENGDTCLHTAIMEQFLEAVRILIKLSPHQMLLDTHNDEAQSPLHLAVITGQWVLARWLIVAGARPNSRNLSGDSPLHIAARNGDINSCIAITTPVTRKEVEQMDLLYTPTHKSDCLNLEQWNYEGQTCLHVAALHGHINVMTHLLKSGSDVNAREGKSGYTVLHIAIESGNEQMAHFLITTACNIQHDVLTYGGRSVLQLGHNLEYKLEEVLHLHGVPSYVSSEDEQDSESDIEYDDGILVESQF